MFGGADAIFTRRGLMQARVRLAVWIKASHGTGHLAAFLRDYGDQRGNTVTEVKEKLRTWASPGKTKPGLTLKDAAIIERWLDEADWLRGAGLRATLPTDPEGVLLGEVASRDRGRRIVIRETDTALIFGKEERLSGGGWGCIDTVRLPAETRSGIVALLTQTQEERAIELARIFLLDRMRGSNQRRQVASLVAAAAKAGIDEKTLRAAAERMGMRCYNGPRIEAWRLPHTLAHGGW